MESNPNMEYRYLGPTGIKVSVISFGNWINSNDEAAKQNTIDCVKKAWDLGVNFFDTAELYGIYFLIFRIWISISSNRRSSSIIECSKTSLGRKYQDFLGSQIKYSEFKRIIKKTCH